MHKDECRSSLVVSKRARGFTLPELLIVVALLSLLVGSIGSAGQWLQQSRIETTILELRTALYMARSEAITRGGRVAICRRADHLLQQCAGKTATGKPDWSDGWLMFLDVDQDRELDADKGDLILRVFPSSHPSIKLHWNRGDYVAYQATGGLDSSNGSFCIGSADNGESVREIVIYHTGRARISAGDCSYDLAAL